ncbi:hypothetical protein AAE02nite_33600 [Adhaeribacter aerolatus]|uniref:Uncharacterized protein n=1 Tax=Adhaeribacter aerolatus TaxID=670289 RepID=A0A512B169_9BACT|nr:hypothetical protein [Adhaeribacter aerolatus]GEO05696.1 hypothetical protein AAE02nite_33600 [Adhaeribacter aerolatus]
MERKPDPLETLTDIRSMMERSSRFISLSGLSGVFAGIFALVGAAAVAIRYRLSFTMEEYYTRATLSSGIPNAEFFIFLFGVALLVLFASLAVAILLTTMRARKHKLPIWDKTAQRVVWNMFIPLSAGGIFCLILLDHGIFTLVAPATLLFYGLALLNTSKYTYPDLRYLALSEISLGLLASFVVGYGLFLWAIGFGVLHIFYGARMYQKYER